jgi:hypothetical protein
MHDHCVSLISLNFLAYVKHLDFIDNSCNIPLNRVLYLHSRLNIKYISSTLACTILIVATLFLFDFMMVDTLDIVLSLTLRSCDLEYFNLYE